MTDAKHSFIDVKQLDSLKAMLSYAFKTLMHSDPFKTVEESMSWKNFFISWLKCDFYYHLLPEGTNISPKVSYFV